MSGEHERETAAADKLDSMVTERPHVERVPIIKEALRAAFERGRAEGEREERARVVALLDSRAATSRKHLETTPDSDEHGRTVHSAQSLALYDAARAIEPIAFASAPAAGADADSAAEAEAIGRSWEDADFELVRPVDLQAVARDLIVCGIWVTGPDGPPGWFKTHNRVWRGTPHEAVLILQQARARFPDTKYELRPVDAARVGDEKGGG